MKVKHHGEVVNHEKLKMRREDCEPRISKIAQVHISK